jgi:hypothetical protein
MPITPSAPVAWLQSEDIVVPLRFKATTGEGGTQGSGLRHKYAQRSLRQQYAADDTNIPEAAVRRVHRYALTALGTATSVRCDDAS